jgi:hypothetical protein
MAMMASTVLRDSGFSSICHQPAALNKFNIATAIRFFYNLIRDILHVFGFLSFSTHRISSFQLQGNVLFSSLLCPALAPAV